MKLVLQKVLGFPSDIFELHVIGYHNANGSVVNHFHNSAVYCRSFLLNHTVVLVMGVFVQITIISRWLLVRQWSEIPSWLILIDD